MREPANEQLRRLHARVAGALGDAREHEIAAATLVPVGTPCLRGCSEKLVVEDDEGARYVFKVPPKRRFPLEAELFATRVRRATGLVSVSNVQHQVVLGDEVLHGYVKPYVANGGLLGMDPLRWTELQRTAVLVDHAFAEMTGNYDTKPDQYVKVGDAATNVDWDHSFYDHRQRPRAHEEPLSRHKKQKPSPPAQQLLWWAFVRGHIDVDFDPLLETAARIAALPPDVVQDAMAPFLARAFAYGGRWGCFATADELAENVLQRQRALPRTFEMFVQSVRDERDRAAGRGRRHALAETPDLDLIVLRALFASPRFTHLCRAIQRVRTLARHVAPHAF